MRHEILLKQSELIMFFFFKFYEVKILISMDGCEWQVKNQKLQYLVRVRRSKMGLMGEQGG
jgi:hypothetical protein